MTNIVKKLKYHQSSIVQWLGLVVVIVVFGIWSDGNLFSAYNLKMMLVSLTPFVLICTGMTFVFAHGGIDISSGAVVALSALCAVSVMNATGSLVLGTIAAVLVSIGCYIINSIITNKFGLMAVITSLAIMFSARGAVTYICSQTPNDRISVATVDVTLFKKDYVFMIIVIILAVLITAVLFKYTKIGKGARAIGDNELAAKQNGIPVEAIKIICYSIAGAMVGLASLFTLSTAGMVQSSTGNGLEMDVLVIVVLGGMSLSGGNNTRISSATVGALTYVLLIKGLSIIGMDPNIVVLVKAVVFLIVIYITAVRNKGVTIPR